MNVFNIFDRQVHSCVIERYHYKILQRKSCVYCQNNMNLKSTLSIVLKNTVIPPHSMFSVPSLSQVVMYV